MKNRFTDRADNDDFELIFQYQYYKSLKHSNASEIKIDVKVNRSLRIIITDNGTGIDLDSIQRLCATILATMLQSD